MEITWLRGNALRLLENGTEFFPALETAIDGATREVFVETYIFANDATGHRIAEIVKPGTAHKPLPKDSADFALTRLDHFRNQVDHAFGCIEFAAAFAF